jgi:predicted nucleotidyltransferase
MPLDAALDALGLALVVRFGSRARGDARADSDLDLAVLHGEGRRLTHRELGSLHLALQDHYGVLVDLVDLHTADALLRYEIIRDGVIEHARSAEAWVDLVARTLIDIDDLGPHRQACIEGVARAARGAA